MVERFRDELGDWRVVLHSPYGDRVHAPWALAITAGCASATAGWTCRRCIPTTGSSSGCPTPTSRRRPASRCSTRTRSSDIITAEVGGSALFASRFRECAARALLLPRRQPGRRTPLWQQRQRSAQLLEIAAQFPGFPITLETVRECLQDVFDVPALTEVLRDLAARRIRMVEVETATPESVRAQHCSSATSARSCTRATRRWPNGARRRSRSTRRCWRNCSAPKGCANCSTRPWWRRPRPTCSTCRRAAAAATPRPFADLLRTSGPLTEAEVAARSVPRGRRRVAGVPRRAARISVRVAGEQMWAAIEDAGRLRDALGVALPVGIPEAFTEPLIDPLGDLVARWARTHGPFTADEVASRYGLGVAVVGMALRRLAADGRVAEGEYLHHPARHQWCDSACCACCGGAAWPGCARRPSRSRRCARPVPARLARDRGVGRAGRGARARRRTGRAAAAGGGGRTRARSLRRSSGWRAPRCRPRRWRRWCFRAGFPVTPPALLDELTSAGEVVWAGAGTVGTGDGWLVLAPAESAPLLLPEPGELTMTPLHGAVLTALEGGGGLFFRMLGDRVARVLDGHPPDDGDLVSAVWDLVWAGLLTNDTLAPLRVVTSGGSAARRPAAPRRTTSVSLSPSGRGPATPAVPGCSTPGRRAGERAATAAAGRAGTAAATAAGPGGRRCRRGPVRPP